MALKPWESHFIGAVLSGFDLLLKEADSESSLFLNPQRLIGIPEPFDI